MVSSKEVNTKKDSWRTKGWPIWDAARKEAGINPNDETANMFPSEAVAYRLLRDAKFVPNQTFYDTVFEGRKLKKPLLSLNQVIIGLRRKLQESIGATVVSVRSEGNSGYALAALGERQETIERYRKEEAVRRRSTVDSRTAIRASRTVTGQIEILLSLGREVTTDDIFDAVFEGKKTQNNLTRISRAMWILEERLNKKGQTIVRGIINGRRTYVRIRLEDVEKVKDELAKKGATCRTPKAKTIKTGETIGRGRQRAEPEIILEEDVRADISESVRIRKKRMSPEEIQAAWQRIALDATEMFLSGMAMLGILNNEVGLERNFEVILSASLPEERLAMLRKSTKISLPDFINAIRRTVEDAWTQPITPEQAEGARMDRRYVRILRYRDILKKQRASIGLVLRVIYEHFGLDIPAEYETAISPYEKTIPKFRHKRPSHGKIKL